MTSLTRLGEREASALIARVLGEKALPGGVIAEIVERTDGIPLFVEEMTKAELEAESEDTARRTVSAVPRPALVVLQGVWTMSSDLEWRVALLGVVFLTDLVVFMRLCRDELRDWRGHRGDRGRAFVSARVAPRVRKASVSCTTGSA